MKYISHSIDWLIAIIGGALLALMIDFNGVMAKKSSPLFASWIVHGVGSFSSLLLVLMFVRVFNKSSSLVASRMKPPLWSYIGGLSGALGLVLAAIAVNSDLQLSGTLVLMLLGQVVFAVVVDLFGFFGHQKRQIMLADFIVILLVVSGSIVIIKFRV